jgi:long-chain acyl-CoA synthetase
VETLLDLLDEAVARFGDRPALAVWTEAGLEENWTYRDLARRTKLAAFRLRAAGLEPGDRILTWSSSMPELAAVYFGAIRAGLVLVPLDLRMSPDAIRVISGSAAPSRLVMATGRDAPDPVAAGLGHLATSSVQDLAAPAEAGFRGEALPEGWEAQVDGIPRPRPDEIWELIFTSGTTGTPKGVMLAHDNVVASIESFHRIIPPLEHRIVSLLPLSHLLEQAVALFYALSVGASITYVRSLNPRVIFEAMRHQRVTSMVVVPQALDLFWSAIEREVDRSGRRALFDRLRAIARLLPMPARRLLFRSVHARLGGGLRLFVSAGAFLPPAIQQAWEDLGVTVLQGYGATETGTGSCTTLQDHGLGTVGRPPEGIEMRIADDGEVQFRGPTLFKGYWHDPVRTAEAFTDDGWYRSGDIGHLDPAGRLILSGRKTDMIVLPNGFNVYPEDVENALRVAGLRDSVVVETRPGRIEAIVLGAAQDERAGIDAAVKAANARLGPNQRVAAWRAWPDDDFPRTHTLKVRRDEVRRRVAAGEVATGEVASLRGV